MENSQNLNKKYTWAVIIVVGIIIGFIVTLNFFGNNTSKPKPVAEVNGVAISREEYDNQLAQAKNLQAWQGQLSAKDGQISPMGTPNKPDDAAMDELINQKLLEQYAATHGISVTQSELEKEFEDAAHSIGTEDKYLEKIKQIYRIDKDQLLVKIRTDLLKEKVQKQTGIPIDNWLLQQRQAANIQKPN
jgi:hypothetical protein